MTRTTGKKPIVIDLKRVLTFFVGALALVGVLLWVSQYIQYGLDLQLMEAENRGLHTQVQHLEEKLRAANETIDARDYQINGLCAEHMVVITEQEARHREEISRWKSRYEGLQTALKRCLASLRKGDEQ